VCGPVVLPVGIGTNFLTTVHVQIIDRFGTYTELDFDVQVC
jgi:hypothetical protein